MNNNYIIGNKYLYCDSIDLSLHSVILIGTETDGIDTFLLFKANEEDERFSESLNVNEHPVYGKYWIITHISDPSIIDVDYEIYKSEKEITEYINAYKMNR